MNDKDEEYLEKGRWNNAEWKFYLSSVISNEENVTAVFGVPIHTEGLVMTKNHRGWELPGGHREIGESVQETLAREILEEAGIRYFKSSAQPIGYLEIMDDAPKINKATGENYPNPSYVIFYAVKTDQPLEKPKEGEALECRIFPVKNLPEIEGETIIKVIPHLLQAALIYAKDI